MTFRVGHGPPSTPAPPARGYNPRLPPSSRRVPAPAGSSQRPRCQLPRDTGMGPRMLRLGLLGCLLLVPCLHGQEPGACAWGWVPFKDGCYGFFSRELSWRRAEAFCQRFGAGTHLASVHSAEEHRAIAALLSPGPGEDSEEGDEGVWIGLHRPPGSRRWQWSDSSAMDYGSWHRQPGPRRRACAALQDTGDATTWYRDACTDRKPFVCKSSA